MRAQFIQISYCSKPEEDLPEVYAEHWQNIYAEEISRGLWSCACQRRYGGKRGAWDTRCGANLVPRVIPHYPRRSGSMGENELQLKSLPHRGITIEGFFQIFIFYTYDYYYNKATCSKKLKVGYQHHTALHRNFHSHNNNFRFAYGYEKLL